MLRRSKDLVLVGMLIAAVAVGVVLLMAADGNAEQCNDSLRRSAEFVSSGGPRKWRHDGSLSQCRPDEVVNYNSTLADGGVCWLNRSGKPCTFGTSGIFNAGAASKTSPCKVGTSLPATCDATLGECFYKSNATAGANLYFCTSTNTWTVQGGGGGGGGASTGEPFVTTTHTGGLSGEFALSDLATGVLQNTNGTGVPTIWNPSPCVVSGAFVIDVNPDGTLVCATIAFSQVTGSVTDAQVPNTITVDLATAATALAANGSNCPANQAAGGVSAAGAAESCIAPLLSTQLDTFAEFKAQVGITSSPCDGTTVLLGDGTCGNAPTADNAVNLLAVHVTQVIGSDGLICICQPDVNGSCTCSTNSSSQNFLLGADLSASTTVGAASRGTTIARGGYVDANGVFRTWADGTSLGVAKTLDETTSCGNINCTSLSVKDNPGHNRYQYRANVSGTASCAQEGGNDENGHPLLTWVETSNTTSTTDDLWCACFGTAPTGVCIGPNGLATTTTTASTTTTAAPTTTTLVAVNDWGASMVAWWGLDAATGTRVKAAGTCSGTTCDLAPGNSPTNNTTTKIEGSASFENADANNGNLSCTDATCGTAVDIATSMTVGMWAQTSVDESNYLLVHQNTTNGYGLYRTLTNDTFTCQIGNGSTATAESATNAFPINTWEHVVCRFDDAANLVQNFVNGATSGSTAPQTSITDSTADFFISSNNNSSNDWVGEIDEAFLYAGAMGATSICRICSCGIQGKLCSKSAADATLYATCSTDADCNNGTGLAKCDTTASKCQGRNHVTPSASVGGCGGCTLPLANASTP